MEVKLHPSLDSLVELLFKYVTLCVWGLLSYKVNLRCALFRLLAHAKVESVKSMEQRSQVKKSWFSFTWFVN